MKPIILRQDEMYEWMRDSWQLYASDYVNDKIRRIWVNPLTEYKVECDGLRIYQGYRMHEAIKAWEHVK